MKIVGLATAVLLSAGALIAPLSASAVTIDELMAQIVALQAQLLVLQGSFASTADKCSFTRSLTVGSRGDDVTCLQNYLKSGGHLSVSATGYFGSLTKAAAASWQAANGVSPAVGYFGPISRAKYDSLMATSASSASSVASSAASSASSVATGEGLTITAATQPVNSLAPESAARIPFTKFTVTAGASDVTVMGVNVEREVVLQQMLCLPESSSWMKTVYSLISQRHLVQITAQSLAVHSLLKRELQKH